MTGTVVCVGAVVLMDRSVLLVRQGTNWKVSGPFRGERLPQASLPQVRWLERQEKKVASEQKSKDYLVFKSFPLPGRGRSVSFICVGTWMGSLDPIIARRTLLGISRRPR